MTFTLARAVGQAAEFAPVYSAADLEIRFVRCGLRQFMPPPRSGAQRYAKTELIAATIRGAVTAAEKGDAEVAKGLQEFIGLVAERCADDERARLQEAARSGGFDLRVTDGEARLLPLDEPRAPLSELIAALEEDLELLGMTTARKHYRQAVDNLVDGHSEAANSQLRATFEGVVTHLANQRGYVRSGHGGGWQAIRFLIDGGHLPLDDGGEYVRGLWRIVHTNGPHPGTSPAGEAHFRTQAITAAIRYLLDRFGLQP
ncbi:hypothetical protein ABZS66_00030 [Dactylosporangium sp. NPDC005572]|uniref:hypothetical protein n=1 Tax=Dactylosporangium sp. NPDC005572 TaxID=3156889 RepID=UPI0033A18985